MRVNKQTPETALKKACRDFLSLYQIWTFPVLQGMGAYKGIGDRLGIWEKGICPHCGGKIPQPLALEFKRPKGRMSPDQMKFRKDWESRGGLFIPVWKVEDLAEALGINTLLG